MHISAKWVVIRVAMHVSAMTGKLLEVVCMYHQGDGGHQRWCACISKDREISRSSVYISAKRVVTKVAMNVSEMTGKLSEVLCMYHQRDGGHQRWCACISRQRKFLPLPGIESKL